MAVALDSTSSSGWVSAPASTTLSHTCGSNNVILVVFVQIVTNGNYSVSGITYNGVALTLSTQNFSYATSGVGTGAWYIVAPASGANNIVVSYTGTVGNSNVKVTGVSLSGANQAAPEAKPAPVKVTATSNSVPVTTVTANAWVLTADVADGNDTLTTPASYTSVTNTNTSVVSIGESGVAYRGPIVTPGAQTISWASAASDNHYGQSLSIAPSVAVAVKNLMLLGVGT